MSEVDTLFDRLAREMEVRETVEAEERVQDDQNDE